MEKDTLFKRILLVSLLTAVCLSIPCVNSAQTTVIKGTVTDQEGNPLKDAQITLLDMERGIRFNLESDKNGNFMKVGLPYSTYQLTVELNGYFPFESSITPKFGGTEQIIIKLAKIPPKLDEDKDFTEGLEFFEKHQYIEAIVSFEKVVQRFPDHYEGYYNLGLSHLRAEHIDQAIIYFEKSVELSPESAESYLALGECYIQKDESEKAARYIAQAVVLQPENPEAHFNLGLAYDKLNKPREALQSYQEVITLKPDLSAAYYQAALSSLRLEDYKGALAYFEKFLEIEPDAPEASQVRAMIDELKKR